MASKWLSCLRIPACPGPRSPAYDDDQTDADILADFKTSYVPSAKSGNVTLANFAALWLEQRSNRTRTDDAQRLRDHVLPRLGSARLSEITQGEVVKLVRDLQGGGEIGLKTAKKAYGVFAR